MRITNVVPLAKTMPNGAQLLANFDLEPSPGITCRLTLVSSARDGEDIIWSTTGARGPSVQVSRAKRAELAAEVRGRLAELTDALRAA